MKTTFLLQMLLLLVVGQLTTGGAGYLLSQRLPWVGLLITVLYIWFLGRTAKVLRQEALKAVKRRLPVDPLRIAFFVALAAQVPGLLVLPYWAPGWLSLLWQGALLPILAILDGIWPGLLAVVGPWFWLAAVMEVLCFTWVAGRAEPDPTYQITPVAPPARKSDWVAARRLDQVEKKGLRLK